MTAPRNVLVDDQSVFGTYAAPPLVESLLNYLHRLPTNWLGGRVMYLLRRLARHGLEDCVDWQLFGARMRLYCEGNASEKKALFAPQFFDAEDRQALAALAEPGAVFLDIGANVGLYTFSIAEHFKDHADTRIVAVEPHPDIHRRLAFNRQQNPQLNIELFQGGIAAEPGTLRLLSGKDNLGQTRLLQGAERDQAETIPVPVITLMELVQRFNLRRVDGIKVDVEGFEESVLLPFFAQAPDALLPRLIVIEDNRDQWAVDITEAAAERGYTLSNTTRMNLWLTKAP